MAVLSTDAPTDTLFAEQLDSAPPFFGFSPAEPNGRGELRPPRNHATQRHQACAGGRQLQCLVRPERPHPLALTPWYRSGSGMPRRHPESLAELPL